MKRDEVFARLDPPEGGLARLRERMGEGRRDAWRWVSVGGAVGVATVVGVVVIVGRRRPAPDLVALARAEGDPSAIALGLSQAPEAAVTVWGSARETTAVTRVATSRQGVVFYWVGSVGP